MYGREEDSSHLLRLANISNNLRYPLTPPRTFHSGVYLIRNKYNKTSFSIELGLLAILTFQLLYFN